MNLLKFINLNYINLILIIGFLVAIFILKIHKKTKTMFVYGMLVFATANLIINYFNSINHSIALDYVYNALIVLIVYLCALVVAPINALSHLILSVPTICYFVISILFDPYIVSLFVNIIYFLFIIVFTLVFLNKTNNKNVSYIILISSMIDIISLLFHFSNKDNLVDISSILLTTIVVHISYFVNENNEKKVNEEKKIQTQRTSIAISQIQPHFLYNSLATIGYICKKDANMASVAIDKFSDYLRANLNSLKQETNILFSEELKHVQTYLWLEKLRFEDRLEIDYDIQIDNFFVPPLSIQPLVENAVKHGICEKVEGGRLTIRTVDYYDCIKIIIEDTGVGFDIKKKPNDGRTHVGIENVRDRIKNMSNGELVIKSTIGVGTVSTITIPKNVED